MSDKAKEIELPEEARAILSCEVSAGLSAQLNERLQAMANQNLSQRMIKAVVMQGVVVTAASALLSLYEDVVDTAKDVFIQELTETINARHEDMKEYGLSYAATSKKINKEYERHKEAYFKKMRE